MVAAYLKGRPLVRLAGGDDASGMAAMLAELLEANLGQFRGRARVAGRARGYVVLTATDHDRSVTLRFDEGEVVVTDGAVPDSPTLAGPWLTLAKVCSGRLSPLRAAGRRELRVAVRGRPALVAGAGYALSVPASFYGEGHAVRRWAAVGAVGAGIALGGVILRSRSSRRGPGACP